MNNLNQKIKNILLGSSLFVAILVIWQILVSFNIVPIWLLPSPAETAGSLWSLILSGKIFSILWVSILNVAPAFLFASLIALILGFAIGMNQTIRKICMPFLSAVYIVPSLAWLPLIILFVGFTRETIWILIFISTFTKVIYSIINGVRSVNPLLIMVGKNHGLEKSEIAYKIVFPASLPHILSGLRLGFGSAWRSLIGAEMLVVTAGGLGKYIWLSQWEFKFDQVLAGIMVIALIGVLVEICVFGYIEKRTLQKWGMMS